MALALNRYPVARGWFQIWAKPADRLAPYHMWMVMPDGRKYRGRLRSHRDRAGTGFWYEGFLTAREPDDLARDEELKRYPDVPVGGPACSLWPCQVKLNPSPPGLRNIIDLVGKTWLSLPDGLEGSAIYYLEGRRSTKEDLLWEGMVTAPQLEEAMVRAA